MKLEITLYREDLFIQKRDKDIKDIDIYDFPTITRELRDRASQIIFIDNDGDVRQTKLLKDRGVLEYTKIDSILDTIDRHGNDIGSKLDKVALIACRNIVKSVKEGKF